MLSLIFGFDGFCPSESFIQAGNGGVGVETVDTKPDGFGLGMSDEGRADALAPVLRNDEQSCQPRGQVS